MNQTFLKQFLLLSILVAPFVTFFKVPPIQAQAVEELDEKELKARKEHEKFVKEMETLIKAAQDSGYLNQIWNLYRTSSASAERFRAQTSPCSQPQS